MVDEDREQRADDGRQAFAVMMAGVRELGVSMHALAQSNTALAMRVGELVRREDMVIQALRASMEHSAALQQQIGVLVNVIAKSHGIPAALPSPAPLPGDPIGRIGGRIVNGAINGVLEGIRRGPARPPGV